MPYLDATLERPCQAREQKVRRARGKRVAVQYLMSTIQSACSCESVFLSDCLLPHLAESAGSAAVEADAATKAAAEAGLLHGSAPDAHRALRECNTGRKQGAGMLVAGAKLLARYRSIRGAGRTQ